MNMILTGAPAETITGGPATSTCPAWCVLSAEEHSDGHASAEAPADAWGAESAYAYLEGGELVLRVLALGGEYTYDADEVRMLAELFGGQDQAARLAREVASVSALALAR